MKNIYKNSMKPTLQLSGSLLKANLKNIRMMLLTLFFPLFLLFTFWISTRWDDPSEFDLMKYMFPAIVSISVMLTGQTFATRLNKWREQDIFQRLTLASIRLPSIMSAMALTQIVMGIMQGLAILLIGILLLGITVTAKSFFIIMAVIILTGMAFTAYGAFIATITKRSELTGYVFFFSLLPLFFIASFPTDMLPPIMGKILPFIFTYMSIELIDSGIYTQAFPSNGIYMVLGLLAYIVVFVLISGKFYNWRD
ncbi:MAG: ABC transporter permease [Asgard group archaeon]|nr:ABC transporter permease [Asgard group archaeon]